MEKYMYITVIILVLTGCTTPPESSGVTISVLVDVTEADFIVKPHAEAIQSLFQFKANPWQSAKFRYGNISSLIHNNRCELTIEGGNALLGNELFRDSEIEEFKSRIDSVLEVSNSEKTFNHSSIFKPMVEELIELQRDTLNKTTLYIYSDLQENNEWFSVHRYSDLKVLKSDPDIVRERFLHIASGVTRNTAHVNVIVIYQPTTIKEDRTFALMKSLYTSVFKDLGIQIQFNS